MKYKLLVLPVKKNTNNSILLQSPGHQRTINHIFHMPRPISLFKQMRRPIHQEQRGLAIRAYLNI